MTPEPILDPEFVCLGTWLACQSDGSRRIVHVYRHKTQSPLAPFGGIKLRVAGIPTEPGTLRPTYLENPGVLG